MARHKLRRFLYISGLRARLIDQTAIGAMEKKTDYFLPLNDLKG
jgi:hypothetical protein